MELLGNVKNYEWGKKGSKSKVAQLAKYNGGAGFEVDETLPYAELWMGDHVSGPSSVKVSSALLSDCLKENPLLMSPRRPDEESLARLPYLFKVLSVSQALSIQVSYTSITYCCPNFKPICVFVAQVHPNKQQAERLHKEFPDVYKDDNHKPELAIALTPFLAMCGFREYHEIAAFLDSMEPLRKLIGEDNGRELKGSNPEVGLKTCFTRLMTATDDEIQTAIGEIAPLIGAMNDKLVTETFTKLTTEFPGDVGILSIFFLNILQLEPGQAIFLAANEPHAYLSGDCIECMACSDNVIRAGLTPKFKDVSTLIEMVNYKAEPKSRKFFQPEICCDGFSKLFIPPVPDFAVKEIRVQSQCTERYQLANWRVGSILLVLQGQAELTTPDELNLPAVSLKPGSIVFIPGCTATAAASELKMKLEGDDTFLAYQAFYNEFH